MSGSLRLAAGGPCLTVSTSCPNCGAPIDFGEGTNALECGHCRSRLLVTGHGRVLSYLVSPRVEASRAISTARSAETRVPGAVRAGEARLVYLPYYRLTATDLRWQRPEPEHHWEPPDPSDYDSEDVRFAALMARLAEQDLVDEIECRDRAIERNFLAIDFPSPALYSLGMRPSALRLELYRRGSLKGVGTLVGAEMTADAALEIGRKTGKTSDVACRVVVGAVLSIVHFPFWLVEIRRPKVRSVTIVDGVSAAVVERGLGVELVQRLGRPATVEPSVIGFRPLVCPNCGWNLPVKPQHVIFYCGSCSRAWRIVGDDFVEMPHRFAGPREAIQGTVAEHLPFWAIRASIGETDAQPFLIPAFRHRRARSLIDLATRLSRIAPSLAASPAPSRAHGGYFDEADARSLALLAKAGATPRSFEAAERYRGEPVRVEENELVWIPFLSDAYSLRDPFRGDAAVTRSLLL
jgi:DNA-directed RNA polymerase subunit RPC12/RpoP